jgi:hypothetical protein
MPVILVTCEAEIRRLAQAKCSRDPISKITRLYTWKYHNETPCTAAFNKQKCLFSKTKDRKVKWVLSGGWHQGEKEDIEKG